MAPIVPKYILNKYDKFALFCDLMHTNGIGFLNSISWHIIFATVIMMKNRKIKNNKDGIEQVPELYLQRGFKITRIHADIEFELLPA